MTLHIDSDQGRIGPFWWINSDTQLIRLLCQTKDKVQEVPFARFGTAGLGNEPYVVMTPLEPVEF